MHFDSLELKNINDQFKDRFVACINSAPRRKGKKVVEYAEIVPVAYYQPGFQLIIEGGVSVASFHLSPLPGCCGVCVSHNASVNFDCRGGGLGKLLNEVRIQMAKDMNYGLLICTDVITNVAQTKILDSVGWKKDLDFVNPKTKHTVNLHHFKL